MNEAPDGRRVFHWSGRNREADTAALAAAIAEVGGLVNRDGNLARLDSTGQLVPVNFATFRKLIDECICGERAVQRDGVWEREFSPFVFAEQPRHDPSIGGPRPEADESAPDAEVLDTIYRHELRWRIPKAL